MEQERLRATIARAQAGDPAGFEVLMDAYGSRLYGYFFRATRNHHDAEDLLGEMMLRLVRRLKTYDHLGRFDQWLFRIAANMVRDRIRRRKTNPVTASLSAEDDSGQSMAEQLPGPAENVDKGLLHAEMSADLAAAMDKLDETTRQMILLRHFGELSFKDIAETFQCPLGTALARVHRGLKAMRRSMKPIAE
ncbi:MAG: RNA polymerase sigma factor [Phycisphaerae bacterium]